ncbi:hypothetical protein T05_1964 [Trichinella murrelli]|uniref:Uncharacterized protein n=1 Tax=Trichinella murrelli TaxID=144512 RepID=A0A0V0T923_9BILA|nr:hypothetical protein T05_1964 [Trichinella murrelli]
MSISCSVLAFTRSAVFSFSDVLSRRMLRRCDCDERLSCEQFRDAILYSRFKTSKAEMDLVVKATDRNQVGGRWRSTFVLPSIEHSVNANLQMRNR